MRPRAAALRSFVSLLRRIAERLDRRTARSPAFGTALPDSSPIEERLLDLRHRLHSRYY
jgi:hypothetical protein